jgi:hypothetical protein
MAPPPSVPCLEDVDTLAEKGAVDYFTVEGIPNVLFIGQRHVNQAV